MNLTYRILDRDEHHMLSEAYASHGGVQPPDVGIVAGAFDGDQLVGFLVLQPILHMEPVWVHPDYRGQVPIGHLVRLIEEQLPHGLVYFAFAPNQRISDLVKSQGFQSLPWHVWRKES